MALFKDEAPILSSNAAIDEGLGVETSAGSKVVGSWNEVLFSQYQTAAPAAGSVAGFFAPYPVEVVDVWVTFATGSTSGTVQVTHDTSANAPGAGTAVMSSTISVASSGTANVPFSAARGAYLSAAASSSILAAAPGTLQLAKGDYLSVKFAGTLTSLANCTVSAILKRI